MKILLGTNNKHKIIEMTRIIKEYEEELGVSFEVLSLKDFDSFPEPIEDGTTYEENAIIKAKYYYNLTKVPTITDDSGIYVDSLKGPGIYSARYAADIYHNATNENNRNKMLKELKGVKDRSAHYCCSVCYYDGITLLCDEGKMLGYILEEETGTNGFGYDPIFFSTYYNKPAGYLTDDEKDKISHRGIALRKVMKKIVINQKK